MPKIYDNPNLIGVLRLNENVWFEVQQTMLLRMANTDAGKDLLCIPKDYKKIFKIAKNHVFYNPRMEDGVYKYDWDFRIGAKWANVIRYRWKEFQEMAVYFQDAIPFRPVTLVGVRARYAFGGPYFPDPSIETTSVDGRCENTNAVWATARDAALSDTVSDSGAFGSTMANLETNYTISRCFFLFDTAAIPDTDTISAATFSLAADGTAEQNSNTTTHVLVASTPASDTAIVAEDYDQTGATSFGTQTFASWNETADTYNDITVLTPDSGKISKTGVTKFATRSLLDIDNTAPSPGGATNRLFFKMADTAGTASDPKLTGTSAGVVVAGGGAALLLGIG